MPRHATAINGIGGKIVDIVNTAHGQDSWKKAIEDPRVDCVVILTPNDLHFSIAQAAVNLGKIVLCEKPLTITSQEAELLPQKNIFCVLQLRYHPLLQTIRENIAKKIFHEIVMDISAYRGPSYFSCWKGKKERSGGVLFNLGSHYFDLLLYLFGETQKVETTYLDDKTGEGIIQGSSYQCKWRVSVDTPRDKQRRIFRIDGIDYNFSSQDNLSYEDLHRYVYEDLLKDKGVTPADTLPSTKLIEQLYTSLVPAI